MAETEVLKGSSPADVSEGGDDDKKDPERGSWLVRNRPVVTVLSLIAGNFICASIISLQAPFFPQEAELKGATPTQYGLIFGIYELVYFMTSPVIGKLVAYIEPKLLLSLGMFVLGSCCILFGLLAYSPAGTPFLALAFSIRIIEGVGASAYTTTSFTIIGSEFPEKIGTIFATVGSAFGVGLIFGPTIGGALFEAGGFDLPFSVMGSLMVVYSVVSFPLLSSVAPDKSDKSLGLKDTLRFWGHYKALIPSFTIFVTFMAIGFNTAVLEPHIRQFGLTPFLVGLVFIVSGGIYGLTSPLWGYISDHWVSPKVLCFLGTLLSILYTGFVGPLPFFPFDTELWMVLMAMTFFGLGAGAQYVCAFSALSLDTRRRGYPDSVSTSGLVSSVFATSTSLGSFTGPSLGGFLFDNIGYRKSTLVFLVLEVILALVLGWSVLQERRELAKEKECPTDCETSKLLQT